MKRHYSRTDEQTHDDHIVELMRLSHVVSNEVFLTSFNDMIQLRFVSWLRRSPHYRWTAYRFSETAYVISDIVGYDSTVGQVMSEPARPIARAHFEDWYVIDFPPDSGLITQSYATVKKWLAKMSEIEPLWKWKRETVEHKADW